MTPQPSPAPTFYEITPIPYIPWEPGIFSWLLMASVFIALLLIGRIAIRHRKPELRGSRSLHSLVIANANRCLADFQRTKDTVHLTRLSLDLRNFLALSDFPDARSLTAGELRSRSLDTKTPELSRLAAALSELDQFEYSPSQSDSEGLRLARALVDALNVYIQRKESA